MQSRETTRSIPGDPPAVAVNARLTQHNQS
jgi:hypothetical protein